jgi:hypothetical protein
MIYAISLKEGVVGYWILDIGYWVLDMIVASDQDFAEIVLLRDAWSV